MSLAERVEPVADLQLLQVADVLVQSRQRGIAVELGIQPEVAIKAVRRSEVEYPRRHSVGAAWVG